MYSLARTDPPSGGLVEGSDGALYGTTDGGGLNGFGAVFKLNKDGSGDAILHPFENRADGVRPHRLAEGLDGSLYGTTFGGGDLYQGTVFQLLPPQTPSMIGAQFAAGLALVSFSGVGGYTYAVSRSSDLAHWTAQTNITMPPISAAFYRARWVP